MNAGIYVFEPELLKGVTRGTRIDMPPLLMEKVSDGEKVNLFPIYEYWLDIGQRQEFETAQNIINDKIENA